MQKFTHSYAHRFTDACDCTRIKKNPTTVVNSNVSVCRCVCEKPVVVFEEIGQIHQQCATKKYPQKTNECMFQILFFYFYFVFVYSVVFLRVYLYFRLFIGFAIFYIV